jgi:N-acetylglucosamine-6-phosphate deacetylase
VIITSPRVVPALPGSGVLEPGYVQTDGGRITGVGQGAPPGVPDLELGSGLLAPGLVDLQVNGYFGIEMSAADPDGWVAVMEGLPATGCTAFQPTFITSPLGQLAEALRKARRFSGSLPGQATRVLGVHVEGPFLSTAQRGAHNPDWIIPPTVDAVDELLAAGAGLLRVVTLAPEVDGGLAAVGRFVAAGVLVSVGHSDATGAQVAAAAGAGARMVTHLFNGQRQLESREPGVVGQALADPRLTSGMIMDTYHVAPAAAAVAFAAAPGRICLVTDAAACAGCPPGEYLLGGEPITLPPGEGVPPHRPDGGLAGSALRMDRAVANMVDAGAQVAEAIAAATRVPADLIGRPDLGRLARGAAADLVWLDDDLRAAGTWIAGERVYP